MTTTNVRWAAPGRATVAAVAAAVRELQGANPLRSVLVVTPPGSTASTLRRLLPSIDGRGIAGIRFTTVPDLALDLSPPEVRLRRPITPLLLTAAVHEQLADHCPPVLAPVRQHPATVDALVQAAERLRAVGIATDPSGVAGGLGQGSDVRRAMVSVALAARAALIQRGLRDEPAVLAAASASLATGAAPPGPVVVVASDAFHPAQMPLLTALLARAPEAVIVACPPAAADTDLAAQLTTLTGQEPPQLRAGAPTSVTSCPDPDEEARWVARQVVALVTGPDAIAPDDVTVLYPPTSGHARSLRDELERSGLCTSGPTIETLAASTAGHALRLLLDAFEGGCDRERVLRVVAVAPEWPFGDGARRNATRWRRLCRTAGVVGQADWEVADERLRAAQRARRQRGAVYDPTLDVDASTERDEWDLQSMASLVGLARRMISAAGEYRRARTWAQASDALGRELAEHIGSDSWREQHWADAPVWQRRAAEQVGALLAALVQFDHPDTPLDFAAATLRRIIDAELDRPVRRAGDPRQGVRLLPLQHGICLEAARVFVVGLNEGTLPPRRVDDLVVPRDMPEACAAVVEHGDWRRRRLRRAWNAVLAGDAPVVATFARTDLRRGGTVYPSTWIEGVEPSVHASYASGLRTLAPLTAAEAAARREQPLGASAVLQRRAITLASRATADATAFDGWIGAHDEHDPQRGTQAITGFEAHARCGLSYFIQRVLRVDTGTDPSEITEIEPMTKGNMVHAVMEQLVGEWLALDAATRPSWLQGPHLDATIVRAAELLDEQAAALARGNLLGNPHAWAIERELTIASLAHELGREANDRLEPLAVEFGFGFADSDTPPYEFEIEELGAVRFWGRVDRIDRRADHVLVTDFKTSGAKNRPTVKVSDVREGSKLQLPLYARVVEARPESLGLPAGTAATARYVYLRRATSDSVPFPDDHLDAFDVIVPHTAQRILAGDFRPSPPDDFGSDVVCPDGLGLADLTARAGQWPTAPVFPDDRSEAEALA